MTIPLSIHGNHKERPVLGCITILARCAGSHFPLLPTLSVRVFELFV